MIEISSVQESMSREMLTTLFLKHVDWVKNCLQSQVRRMKLSPEIIDDVCQRAFVILFKKSIENTLIVNGEFKGYLLKVVSNQIIAYSRRLPKEYRDGIVADIPVDALDHTMETPENIALARESAVLLQRALETLPPEESELLRLRHDEDLSVQKIANETGSTLNSMATKLGNIHKKVRKVLEPYFNSDIRAA